MAGFPWESNDPISTESTSGGMPWENDPIVDDSSAPWENDPIVEDTPSQAAPWESDPIVADSYDSEPEKASSGIVGAFFGVPVIEAGASLVSNMIGATFGGAAGATKLATGSELSESVETIEDVTNAMTYQPRTEEGQIVLEAAAYPFEKIAEFGEWLGDETLEATHSPLLATAARLVPDIAMMAAPLKLKGKGKGKGKGKLDESLPDEAPVKTSAETGKVAKGEEIIAEKPSQKPIAEGVAETIEPKSVKTINEAIPAEIAHEPIGIYLDAKSAPIIPKKKNGLLQIGESFIDKTGGKAITPVRKLGRENPYFRTIADWMEPPDTVDVSLATSPVKHAFHEGVSKYTGEFMSKFQSSVEPHLTRLGTMPKKIQAEVVKGLRDSKYKVADELKPLVWDLRKVLDEVHVYAKEAGIDVGYLKDYLPRVYNRKMVRDNPEKFSQILVDHGLKPDVAKKITENIIKEEGIFDPLLSKIERIEDISPKELLGIKTAKQKVTGGSMKGAKSKNLESSRVLHEIPDAAFGDFLKADVMGLIPRYIEHSVHRGEWVRRYGIDGVKLNNQIKKGIKHAHDNGQPLTRSEIDRIYDIADAQQMQWKQIDTPAIAKANQWYSTYQLIRTLPMATLASMAEPGVIFLRGTSGAGFKGLGAGFKHLTTEMARKVNKNIPKAEATRAAEELGVALDHAISERMLNSFGGEATKVTHAFFKANLLHGWTRMNRVAGFVAGREMATGHLQRLAGTKKMGILDKMDAAAAKQRYKWELKELGVDVNKGIEWVQNGMNKADPFYDQINLAGIRFTNDVVMNPRVTNRPMWHSNPQLRLFNQLKGFQTTFGNTVTKRIAHEMFGKGFKHGTMQSVKFFTVLATMANLNIAVQMFRDYLNYGEEGNPRKKGWNYTDHFVDGMQRTGILGALQIGIDSANGYRYGSSFAEGLLGPGASQIGRTIQAGSQAIQEGQTGNLEYQMKQAIPAVPGLRDSIMGDE